MKFLSKIFGILFGTLLAAFVLAYFWLQDTSRVQRELQDLLNRNADYQVELNGNVQWQLLPSLYLKLEDVVVHDDKRRYHTAAIEISVASQALWESVDEWQVDEVRLTDITLSENDIQANWQLPAVQLNKLRSNKPVPLVASFVLHPEPAADEVASDQAAKPQPITGTIETTIVYVPESVTGGQSLELQDLQLTSNAGNATCQIQSQEQLKPPIHAEADTDVLPVNTLSAYDFALDCSLENVVIDDISIAEATVTAINTAQTLDASFATPGVYGGAVDMAVSVDYHNEPVLLVDAALTDIRIEQALAGSAEKVNWAGPLSLDGQIEMRGNHEEDLQNSMQGTIEFDSANGEIDVRRIKSQLRRLAALTNRSEEVETWPDTWPYQLMQGRWRIQGRDQQLNVAIDNMSVKGEGDFEFADRSLDILSEVTIHTPAAQSDFSINPILLDTPIPIRCRGQASDPTCRLDEKAGQNLIAKSLQRDSDTGVRRKLEQKIDEEVPEEYREVARDLLDLLGRALERN